MVDAWNLTILKPLDLAVVAGGGFTNPANLQSYQPGEKATLPVGAPFQVYDLGSAQDIRQLALLYTTLDGGDSIRITASNNADGVTAAVLDTGVMVADAVALARPSGYRHFFYHRLAGSQSARYVRVTAAIAGANAYAGRLVVGTPFQPELNANFGDASWGYEELDQPELLDSGVEVLYENDAPPVFQFTLGELSEAEFNASLEPLSRLQHEGVPVLVVRRPDAHTYRHNALYYGLLRMSPPIAVDYDVFEAQCKIRSML